MKLTLKQRDILLAGAIGDAVGYVVEFTKLKQIIKQYGPDGLTLDIIHPEAKLIVSDDTQMTLFTLEALYRGGGFDEYLKSYQAWYQTQLPEGQYASLLGLFPSMQYPRAPGNTCLSALAITGRRPSPVNNSKGCGAIMRTAPCAFAFDMYFDVWNESIEQSKVTHGHPSGYISAAVFAVILKSLTDGDAVTLREAMEEGVASCRHSYDTDAKEVIDAILLAETVADNPSPTTYLDVKRIGEGWVGEEALAIALYSVLKAKSFEEVIKISINHDGDSDSTGSLAAQLWVAAYGLPEEYRSWEARLDVADAFAFVTDENNYKVSP